MKQFCVELISKMKKSIDFGISAKQSYMHVLWQGNYLEGFEVSKQLFSREIDVGFRIVLKPPNDLPGARELSDKNSADPCVWVDPTQQPSKEPTTSVVFVIF